MAEVLFFIKNKMKCLIATVVLFGISLILGCKATESKSVSDTDAEGNYSAREQVREFLRIHQLEIIYYGEARWPSIYKNLDAKDKLRVQMDTMERIRNRQPVQPIPLTKTQVDQLDREGHFSGIFKSQKIK